jgi:hypothetical protein
MLMKVYMVLGVLMTLTLYQLDKFSEIEMD